MRPLTRRYKHLRFQVVLCTYAIIHVQHGGQVCNVCEIEKCIPGSPRSAIVLYFFVLRGVRVGKSSTATLPYSGKTVGKFRQRRHKEPDKESKKNASRLTLSLSHLTKVSYTPMSVLDLVDYNIECARLFCYAHCL